MQHYSLAEANHYPSEILDKARVEPVVINDLTQPSHVILSYEMYQHLLKRCAELEDVVWGKAATDALKQSQMVGKSEFMATLSKLANGEA